jgi:hypothetical protein
MYGSVDWRSTRQTGTVDHCSTCADGVRRLVVSKCTEAKNVPLLRTDRRGRVRLDVHPECKQSGSRRAERDAGPLPPQRVLERMRSRRWLACGRLRRRRVWWRSFRWGKVRRRGWRCVGRRRDRWLGIRRHGRFAISRRPVLDRRLGRGGRSRIEWERCHRWPRRRWHKRR